MTAGIAFFAYNTEQIDYVKLATLAGRYARLHMPDRPICLITDSGTWDWFSKGPYKKYAELAFDDVVLAEADSRVNKRTHFDSPYHNFSSDFKNGNKHKVIDYTPYDQTLLLDIDYIVQNNSLEYVFDSDSAVTLFHSAESLIGELPPLPQQNLNKTGAQMMWSTVVYFDKHQDDTKMFFDLWSHVRDEYDFYRFLYNFPGHMYRTDYCVSVAKHIMNGMGTGDIIDDFPRPMINMSQHDDIAKINSVNDWTYLVNNRKENWENSLTRITKENVHVMNKRSLERNFDMIMQKLDEADK